MRCKIPWRDILNTVMEFGFQKWRKFLANWAHVCHGLTSTVLELEYFASTGLRDVVFLWEQREWPIGLCDQCPCLREKETKRLAKNGLEGGWEPSRYTLGWCLVYWKRWDFWSLRTVIPKILCLELGLPRASPFVTLPLMLLVLETFLSVVVDAVVLVLLKCMLSAHCLYEAYRCIVATINNSTVCVKRNTTHSP